MVVLCRLCIGLPVPGSLYLKLNTVYSQVFPGNCKLASNRLVSRTGNAIGIVAVRQVVVAVLIRLQISVLVVLAGHRNDRCGVLSASSLFYCKVYFIDRQLFQGHALLVIVRITLNIQRAALGFISEFFYRITIWVSFFRQLIRSAVRQRLLHIIAGFYRQLRIRRISGEDVIVFLDIQRNADALSAVCHCKASRLRLVLVGRHFVGICTVFQFIGSVTLWIHRFIRRIFDHDLGVFRFYIKRNFIGRIGILPAQDRMSIRSHDPAVADVAVGDLFCRLSSDARCVFIVPVALRRRRIQIPAVGRSCQVSRYCAAIIFSSAAANDTTDRNIRQFGCIADCPHIVAAGNRNLTRSTADTADDAADPLGIGVIERRRRRYTFYGSRIIASCDFGIRCPRISCDPADTVNTCDISCIKAGIDGAAGTSCNTSGTFQCAGNIACISAALYFNTGSNTSCDTTCTIGITTRFPRICNSSIIKAACDRCR